MSDILNCGIAKQKSELVRFTYQCLKYWDTLEKAKNDSVRFCDACQENVYYCSDKQEAEEHARKGHCIAIAKLAALKDTASHKGIASELTTAVDEQYDDSQYMFMGIVQAKTRPEYSKAWGKDIFDR